MKQFSKKMLFADYVITIILLIVFFIAVFMSNTLEIDYGTFGMIICAWIAQLGVSSTAYYVLIKSEHKVELPIYLLNELPNDVKENIDMTAVITTVLTSVDN